MHPLLRWTGRAVIRTLAYIWYPLLFTIAFAIVNDAGVFDGPGGSQRLSYLILGVLLWKLAAMITRTDLVTAVKLVLGFCWMVGYIAWWAAAQPQWGSISTHVWIALIPLGGGIKRVMNQDAEIWVRSKKWYRGH